MYDSLRNITIRLSTACLQHIWNTYYYYKNDDQSFIIHDSVIYELDALA